MEWKSYKECSDIRINIKIDNRKISEKSPNSLELNSTYFYLTSGCKSVSQRK